jgi:hypothetical protein
MNSSKNKQRGASLIGILIIGGVLVFGGIVAAQVAPTYFEFRLIGKTIDKVKGSGSAAEVRTNFDKTAQIDDIKSITGKDLEFTQEGTKTVISFAYTKEIHLAGPAYLLMKYAGRSN